MFDRLTRVKRLAAAIGVAAACVVTALAGIAAIPVTACACSTKAPVLINDVRRPLEEAFEEQVALRETLGRFATRAELDADGWRPPQNFAALAAFVATDSLVRIVTTATSLAPGATCTLEIRAADALESGDADRWISCVGLPDKAEGEREVTIAYAAVVLLAVVVRLVVAGRSQPPIGLGTVGGFLALALLHPFWFLIEQPSWCDEGTSLGNLWIAIVAVYILRTAFFGRYEPRRLARAATPSP